MNNTLIEQELDKSYFTRTKEKFLHNIDTFYYSVKLENDFTRKSLDHNVKEFRDYLNKYSNVDDIDKVIPVFVQNICDLQLNYMPFTFAGFYKHCISCPDRFDIFIAEYVPGGQVENVTSEMVIQIRSMPLWLMGINAAYEESYRVVENLCNMFNLTIKEVKENRIDYCWHSNSLQKPSEYFRIDNFTKMQVSRFKRIHYEYQFKPGDEYENDYICLGKRSDKVFVRIYLKSKEVIEKNYKPWFLEIWHQHGMISDYDKEVYETMYLKNSWKYMNDARLEFYLNHGSNEYYKNQIRSYFNKPDSLADISVKRLADKLTPPITLVTNVEFQTMRKSSKSYILKPLKNNEKYGVQKRIYDYLDNRALITEYLTHDTLRLINRTDDNKSRCDYNYFWKSLRECKFIDVAKLRKNLKLTRHYNKQLNKEVVKNKLLHMAITYSLYSKGLNDDNVVSDATLALTRLNDNDIYNMTRYKEKKKKLLNEDDLIGVIDDIDRTKYIILNEDGEII